MEVCQFHVSEIDGNGDSVSITDGNKISVSVRFHQTRFLFSVSGPSSNPATLLNPAATSQSLFHLL